MSDYVLIFLSFTFLVAMFIFTRLGIARRFQRASEEILRDLERQEAVGPITAVELGYAKPSMFRLGMRDYHSKSLEYMVAEGVVGKTGAGKYYLKVARTTQHDGTVEEGAQ